MKAFQIFSHPFPPCEPYFGYMQRIRDMAESYTLIAPRNFMGPRAHFVPLDELWAEIPAYFRANPNGHNQFDPPRVRYLATHFEDVYLDIDIELREPLEILEYPQCDGPGVLLGNGDANLGLSCWETYLRLSPSFSRPATLMFSDCPSMRNIQAQYHHHLAHGAYF